MLKVFGISSRCISNSSKFWFSVQRYNSSNTTRSIPPLFEGEKEILTPEQQAEKEMLIKELTKRLSGPLADSKGKVPTGDERPTAIEVDGPSHFYVNSTKYTAYSKLKHRLLTRMGYRVLHVPYFEWRKLRGTKEREEYMRLKLQEQPSEWLDPEDEVYYNQRIKYLRDQEAALNGKETPTN